MTDEVAGRPEGDPAPEEEGWPWTFILTIVMVGVYLAYRLFQGAVLLFDWLL